MARAGAELVTHGASLLSKEEYEEWVQQAFVDEQEIKAGFMAARGGMWRAAKALHHFAETTGWVALGYPTLGDWLADPDVTLPRSTYHRLQSMWQEFVVIRKVDEDKLATLDLTKAQIALPALKRGEVSLEDVLSDVEVLGARDLRTKYAGSDTYPTADEDGDIVVDSEPEWAGPADEDGATIDTTGTPVEGKVDRGIAETLTRVLEAVLSELGNPDTKRMSKSLREQVAYALSLAYDEGLGDVTG